MAQEKNNFNKVLSVVIANMLSGSEEKPVERDDIEPVSIEYQEGKSGDLFDGYDELRRRRNLETRVIGGRRYSMSPKEWDDVRQRIKVSMQKWVEEQELKMSSEQYAELVSLYELWKNGDVI